MKKFVTMLAALFALTAFGAGCDKKGGGNFENYTDVAGKPADASFSFETDLGEKQAAYPAGSGRTFYVSAEGSDENDGLSRDKPLKSIAAVNKLQLKAGDSVCFRGGDTFEGNLYFENLKGEEDEPITFCGYDDENARAHLLSLIHI